MTNYFAKNVTGTKAYRAVYQQAPNDAITVTALHACSLGGVALPDGSVPADVDDEVPLGNLIVDMVIQDVTACTVEEYTAIAIAAMETNWG